MSMRTLGKYVLRERIGRGGMAEVYQAYQPGLERFVAVKLLHPHLAETPDFLARFQREAQAVSQLRHPHIVQVFDYDVEAGQPYMVMEFVDGQSLKALLDDQFSRGERLPLPEILRLFDDLLDAVEYAHAGGMIHRDLKPANVLLEKTGRVVLTDFGIARLVNAERLTQTGITLGSPAYMSPEQGQGEPADTRADIYALGVMLFECLTGQVPYEAETSVAVLLKHASAPVPSLLDVRPDLPPALDTIIKTALAKKPTDRYQSAAALGAALQTVALGAEAPAPVVLPIVETQPAPPAHRQFRPRRRAIYLGAALSLTAALAVLAALAGPRWLAQTQAAAAVQLGTSRLAEGADRLAVDAFSAALAADPGHLAALAGRARAYEALLQIDAALADVEAWIAADPRAGDAYAERARLTATYSGAADDPAAILADVDRAVQLAPASAHAHFVRGWALLNFALLDPATAPADALPDLQRAAELDPADAETQYTLARARWANAEPQAALDPASRAVELAPAETSYWAFRAQLQASLGDYIAAGDDLTQALKVETDAPAQAVLLAKRAYLHRLLNAPAAAQADADQALALAPAAALARVMAALARDTAPAPADLAAARAQAPADDLLWQGIVGVQP